MLDLGIIGGGPAGLSAGLYATRGGLKNVVMFDKGMPGGQIISSSEIENYPGVAQVETGMDFMNPWIEQSTRFGLKHEMALIKRVTKNSDKTFSIILEDGKDIKAKTVVICTGAVPKKVGCAGEDEFFGRGVSTCATCDGFFYKNKEVVVVGGGDTALEEALYLANICSKVYLVHRREGFRAAPVTVEKVQKNQKIELVLNTVVDEIKGDKSGVTNVIVKFNDGKTRDIAVPGIFTFVGLNVNNQVLKQVDGSYLCNISKDGEVIVDLKMRTSVDGLFAAGDIRIDAPRQVVCAASDGAIAALGAISYIESLH